MCVCVTGARGTHALIWNACTSGLSRPGEGGSLPFSVGGGEVRWADMVWSLAVGRCLCEETR